MVVLIDKYIPCLDHVLDGWADVEFLSPEEFTPSRVQQADALIIRTRTRIDAQLLEGSKVRFVATATIGYDHIDTAYCQANHIFWTNCPGCNSQAVCDYIEEALQMLKRTHHTLGVVGIGHVGEKVVKMAERIGFRVLQNDPPKGIGVSLDEIAAQSDIITFHTPLSHEGNYPTYHLCDEAFLTNCQEHAVIINAARGGIVDEQALLASEHSYIIDCWEGEPHICRSLCCNERALYTSYHIAGYSQEGKKNASQMCLDALCRYFHLPSLQINTADLPPRGDSEAGWLARITQQLQSQPEAFETLRKRYALR